MALNLNDVVQLTYSVRDRTVDPPVPANPTTATLTITQPDGTTISPAVDITPTDVGELVVDFLPTQAGLHSVAWTTTLPGSGDTDVFIIEQSGVQLISVDEALAHLNAAGVITGSAEREQVQWLCMVATDAVERDLDQYLVRRTVTQTAPTGTPHIRLKGPVLSITSVTVNGGAALDASTYSLTGGWLASMNWWGYPTTAGTVTVTYVAGYPNPPRVTRLVALGVVQGLWQSSQQAPAPFLDEAGPAQDLVGASIAGLPDPLRRAYDALRMPGIA